MDAYFHYLLSFFLSLWFPGLDWRPWEYQFAYGLSLVGFLNFVGCDAVTDKKRFAWMESHSVGGKDFYCPESNCKTTISLNKKSVDWAMWNCACKSKKIR